MEYNYNSWAGVPPNPALYPNHSPPVMTNSDQSVPQNPNPSSYALGYGGGHEFQEKCLVYRYGQIDGATSSVEAMQVYYQDPNVVRLLGSNGPFRTGESYPVDRGGARGVEGGSFAVEVTLVFKFISQRRDDCLHNVARSITTAASHFSRFLLIPINEYGW
ncbi:hypothetical protein KY285_013443 [Solanum tuberosum]|nr:hypothetical protein KY285_013443 [Solanum tuberosum]